MKSAPIFSSLVFFALAAGSGQAAKRAVEYRGDTVAGTLRGRMLEPTFLTVSGGRVTGKMFSNAMGQPVPLHAKANAGGRFRMKVATKSGVTGWVRGRVHDRRVVANGRLRKASQGLASVKLRAKRKLPEARAEVLPDLTGTRRLYLSDHRIADSYESINFTMVKEADDYSYRAVFADGPGRTDRVDARVPFPTGMSMGWTNDFSYWVVAPVFWVKITFDVSIRYEYAHQGMVYFSVHLEQETFDQPAVSSGDYHGWFSIP